MSDRERSPTLIESGLKNLIGGRDSNYPLISGINGKYLNIVSFVCKISTKWNKSMMRTFHTHNRTFKSFHIHAKMSHRNCSSLFYCWVHALDQKIFFNFSEKIKISLKKYMSFEGKKIVRFKGHVLKTSYTDRTYNY